MQHIMCNTKNTRLLLKYFTYEQLLMRLVLMSNPPVSFLVDSFKGIDWNKGIGVELTIYGGRPRLADVDLVLPAVSVLLIIPVGFSIVSFTLFLIPCPV